MVKFTFTFLLVLAPFAYGAEAVGEKKAPAPYRLSDPEALARLKALFEACQAADAAYVKALSDETVIKKTYDQSMVVRSQAKIESDKAASDFAAEWAKQHGDLPIPPPTPPGPGPNPGPAPNNDQAIPAGSLWLICVVPDLATVTGGAAEVQKGAKLHELLDARGDHLIYVDPKTVSNDQASYLRIAKQQSYPNVGMIADATKAPNAFVEAFPLKDEADAIAHVKKYVAVTAESKWSVVALHADWCSFCPQMMPIWKRLEVAHKVEYIDTSKDKAKLERYKPIDALPSTIVLKDGIEVKRFSGVTSRDTIQGAMK